LLLTETDSGVCETRKGRPSMRSVQREYMSTARPFLTKYRAA